MNIPNLDSFDHTDSPECSTESPPLLQSDFCFFSACFESLECSQECAVTLLLSTDFRCALDCSCECSRLGNLHSPECALGCSPPLDRTRNSAMRSSQFISLSATHSLAAAHNLS